MQRIATLFVIILLLYACTMIAPPQGGGQGKPQQVPEHPTGGNPIPATLPTEKITLDFSVNTTSPIAVHKDIYGFNTGFMFGGNIEDLPEVQRLSKSLSPVTLRFPGGTIANYYHPNLNGYGFKEEEVGQMKDFEGFLKSQPFEKSNYLDAFAKICKLTNSDVMFVANMLTGTIAENILAIDRLREKGLKIVGIELGNEFLLQRYRNNYPDVQTYITQAKSYAMAFRKKYPEIPLGVVGSEEGASTGTQAAQFTSTWNTTLSKESFFDAVVYHFYANTNYCNKLGDNGSSLKEVFDCALETTAIEHYDMIKLVTSELIKTYGTKRKIWITEWNTQQSPKYVGNTFIQAAMAAEFMFNTIEFNAANNNLIEYAHFHNYSGAGFANTLFSYNSQKLPTLNGDPLIGTNATYYPFLFFKEILFDGKASLVPLQYAYSGGLDDKQFNLKGFYNKDTRKLYLYYVNKSPSQVHLSNTQVRTAMKAKKLLGNNLYSSAGQTGFMTKRAAEFNLLQYKESAGSSLEIAPFSLGYFEVQM